MLKSFNHKELKSLWTQSRSKIDAKMHKRILRRLTVLDEAITIKDLNLPGFDFHALHGFNPTRYTIHVNGPWCITFEFHDGHAYNLNFEQYH
ncbi:type II toxin-antitoxin system RelE/ParE family toxin [Bartonella sp. DGB2]|uniref:type II toxin-antitoxin system RelE/ParE family toxin n=1 Tax=Bartonella sp. DGB2 TaxID=3388426 RepID=UPI00398FA065